MRALLTSRFMLAAALSFLAAEARAQEHPQDLLKEAWIKTAWTEVLKGERFQRRDSWIPSLDGVASAPELRRDASGRPWTVANLCQPHNCADNKLLVLVDRDAKAIWALQKTAYPTGERFFGRPDAGVQTLLRAALAGNLAHASLPSSAGSASPSAPPAQGLSTLTLSPAEATAAPAQPASAVAEPKGSIEGELSYPSDYIPPDMTVCAEDVGSGQQHCTSRKTRQRRALSYRLELPPGEYRVYARTKEQPGYKAFYSEFVACGIQAGCKSHQPIVVAVPAGSARKGINPQDWYVR